jgi:outer membrane protein insertion porin family
VHEGQRSRIGQILYEGNNLFTPEQLRKKPRIKEGDFFSAGDLTKDVREMLEPYWDRGHTYARVVPVPLFTEKSGVVDLKFQIDEDRQRYIRFVTPQIAGDSPYTQESVVLNRLGLRPGDLADPRKINRARSRINGGGLFSGVSVVDSPVNPETSMFTAGSANDNDRIFRGQQPIDSGHSNPSWVNNFTATHKIPRPTAGGHSFPDLKQPQRAPQTTNNDRVPAAPVSPDMSLLPARYRSQPISEFIYRTITADFFRRPWGHLLTSQIMMQPEEPTVRAQNPGEFLQGSSVLQGGPFSNQFQDVPPGWVDIDATANEGRTGRLMFGAGVNSDNGIVGSFVWEENNFDLFNPPASFSDIINGRAFRGKGQRFRAEAAPGDIVSRYAINWVDQYFMNTDYSLSVSGFLYNRFFDDWSEERAGGRIGFGKQLNPTDSVSATLRLEEVQIANPRTPVPGVLAESVGSNFLSTIRLATTHDTRDAAILPADGHYMEGGFEQAFGEYDYSRVDIEGRKFFTLFRRPDDSGKQVLTLSTNLGFATSDTPVYERYFAGGFQSFRGFAYRGVTPQVGGVAIGGTFQALATVEYRVPVTADDMIHVVTFADVGTVDNRVSFDRFRATVGVGLRVTIPAMGQVPLAFDFGFPVASEAFDDERIFSFYVGILN